MTLAVAIVVTISSRILQNEYRRELGNVVLKQASNGDFSQVSLYLDSHGDPNQRDLWGVTIAYYAISYSDKLALQTLIDRGSKLRYHSWVCEDNLTNAICKGDHEIISMVLATGEWDDLSKTEIEKYLLRAEQRRDSTDTLLKNYFGSRVAQK
jgi:hypothetical protein